MRSLKGDLSWKLELVPKSKVGHKVRRTMVGMDGSGLEQSIVRSNHGKVTRNPLGRRRNVALVRALSLLTGLGAIGVSSDKLRNQALRA